MTPFGLIALPDDRIAERLVQSLRRDASISAFVAAGEVLASSIVVQIAGGPTPRWHHSLADAVVASLIRVQQRAAAEATAEERVGLATTAMTAALVYPRAARVLEGAANAWMGLGLWASAGDASAEVLAARVLHLLRVDDTERAVESVDRLVDCGGAAGGWVLLDWVVARVQGHGDQREAQCFHNLRVALGGRQPVGAGAGLLLLAAVTVVRRADRSLDEVLPWLRQVAFDVSAAGTSRLSAAV